MTSEKKSARGEGGYDSKVARAGGPSVQISPRRARKGEEEEGMGQLGIGASREAGAGGAGGEVG
jgi:hypothetical protein